MFSITPFLHRDPEIMMRFKMMNRILFPKYMHVTIMSEFLKDFIFKVKGFWNLVYELRSGEEV